MAESRVKLIHLLGTNINSQDFQEECNQIGHLLKVYSERIFQQPLLINPTNEDMTLNELQQIIDQLKATYL